MYACQSRPNIQINFLCVLIILLAITIAGIFFAESYVTSNTHGNTKHADVYDTVVRACKEPDYRLYVRESKRIDVCFIKNLGWGFQVWKQIGGNGNNKIWSERTAYIFDDIKTEDDLMKYARDMGYFIEKLK